MSNDPQLSLGSNPTPAEVATLDAWRRRHPGPGGNAAPNPNPNPVRRRINSKRPQQPHEPYPEPPADSRWRRGTIIRDRTEYAYTTAGVAKKLRTWNVRAKSWAWTPAGLDYYRHNRMRFIVNVPCLGYIPRQKTRAGGDPANHVLLRATFFGQHQCEREIPLSEDTLADFAEVPAQVQRLTAVGLVHDGNAGQEAVQARLKQVVTDLLSQGP